MPTVVLKKNNHEKDVSYFSLNMIDIFIDQKASTEMSKTMTRRNLL